MAAHTYKVGDIVRPVGGGPNMVIISIEPYTFYCESCNKSNLRDGKMLFECVWFQTDDTGMWNRQVSTFYNTNCIDLVKKGK